VGRCRYTRNIVAPLLFGLAAALVPSASAQRSVLSLTPWVAADFDGDTITDLAHAGSFRPEGGGFIQEISLRFSATESRALSVRVSAVAFKLVARDVDGDSDRDLIVEALTREPLAILLNDGEGQFHEAPLGDFGDLFSHHERSSWDAAARRFPNTFARDVSRDDASIALSPATFTYLIPAGLVDSPSSRGSSAILFDPQTRAPPAR
jgi:hypothetical protein